MQKIIDKTEFIVQKKTGGWDGWNIYARHPKFSKYSVEKIQKVKPRLTRALKEKIVRMAVEERAAEKYNSPIFDKMYHSESKCRSFFNDFMHIVFENSDVYNSIKEVLEKNCEYVKYNQALQRLLDLLAEKECRAKLAAQLKNYPSRKI